MSFESSLHIMTFNRCQGYQVIQGIMDMLLLNLTASLSIKPG